MFPRMFALLQLILLSPLFAIISLLIFFIDGVPVFFIQKRVGKNSRYFNVYKFRTMKIDTPNVATHLLKNHEQHVSSFGKFLRRYSLDELPNLINIAKGEMGFVGPRPVLYKELDLIQLRKKRVSINFYQDLPVWHK